MIFLSYSSKNEQEAGKIKEELEGQYYECFFAEDNVAPGADWHQDIWSHLVDCDAFVGIVTKEFTASAFCQQEVGAALALSKPSLLLLLDVPKPPGFAERFQAVKQKKFLETLGKQEKFGVIRVKAWIAGVHQVTSFADSKTLHRRFEGEWKHMSKHDKLKWLLAAAANQQVRGDYVAGAFFDDAHAELKKYLTRAWLKENDKGGFLHR